MGKPSLLLPIIITLVLVDSASFVVASIPLIFKREGVKLLLIILFATASPSAAILFLSASLSSL